MRQFLPYLPNAITLVRILLVPPLAWLILRQQYREALLLIFIAGLSDGLDGWLARVGGWRSRFGAALDAVADKFLIVVTFSCLWWQGLLPLWLVVVAIARDACLVVGGFVYNRWFERLEMLNPSRLSKWNTALQIGLMLLAVVAAAWPQLALSEALFYMTRLVLLTTLITFADYAWTWSRRAQTVGLKH